MSFASGLHWQPGAWLRRHGMALLALLAACLVWQSAHAQLRVDISGTGATQYPIAIADFDNPGDSAGATVAGIIRADLSRTGQFQLISAAGVSLNVNSSINGGDWRNRGADYVAYGSVSNNGGNYTVSYRLMNTVGNAQLDGVSFTGTAQQLRRVSHQIADRIYEKITGIPGIFSTRIAYVLKQNNIYELIVADADSQNPQVALRSREPIISPRWSPDGTKLAYVSFETGKAVVYVHTLATSARIPVANYKGDNSAPAWSPDGQHLAIALSRSGLAQIYLINSDGSGLRRLTQSAGIDTEPRFTPDGQSVIFTSDRAGSPQIYEVSINGGDTRRLTFTGNYNISPSISPDGKTLAYVAQRDGNYHIASLNLASGQETILTHGTDDESPSFAPNGMEILYASQQGGRGVLSVVSSDGRVTQTLSTSAGSVQEPAWGPFPNAH